MAREERLGPEPEGTRWSPVAPTRGGTGPQWQYQWPPTAIMGGPQSVEYSPGHRRRKKLTSIQITEVSKWWSREEELSLSIARAEAVRLAKHVLELDEQLAANEKQLDELVQANEAAPLLEDTAFRAISASRCLAAWSHEGRVRNDAAFAALAGANPIPASSGNTVRHQLNRGGDRTLNSALHMVAIVRMTQDDETLEYVEKRHDEGLTDKEIRRSIKRHLARRIYRTLNASATAMNAA